MDDFVKQKLGEWETEDLTDIRPSEYSANQEGFEVAYKEEDERSSRSPDSQGTENIEMGDLDNESATVEDLGEDWCEEETGNLCDPLCHMTSDVLHDGSPDSSDEGDGVSYGSKRGPLPRGGSKGGKEGRALRRASGVKTKPIPTCATRHGSKHSDQTYQVLEDVEVLSDTPRSPEKRTETDSPVFKKRRKTTRLILNDAQEAGLVQWLQDYPELYNKGSRKYKDIELKNSLWEQKAAELDIESGELLQIWYKSMRTRFGKLRKVNPRDRGRDFTSRDQWILENFAFMSPHIYVCPNRGAAIQKLQSRSYDPPRPTPQPQSGSEDDDNEDDVYNIPTIPSNTTAPSTSATPSAAVSAIPEGFMKIESSQSATAPDANLEKQAPQSTPQANRLLAGGTAIPSGPDDTMAKGYGTFLSTVVPSLHPSLLMKFYHESWALVMKYHSESEQLKRKEQQRQRVPVAVRPVVHPPSQLSSSNPQSQYFLINPQGSSQRQPNNHHMSNSNAS